MTPHVSTFETAEPALLELLTHIHTGKPSFLIFSEDGSGMILISVLS